MEHTAINQRLIEEWLHDELNERAMMGQQNALQDLSQNARFQSWAFGRMSDCATDGSQRLFEEWLMEELDRFSEQEASNSFSTHRRRMHSLEGSSTNPVESTGDGHRSGLEGVLIRCAKELYGLVDNPAVQQMESGRANSTTPIDQSYAAQSALEHIAPLNMARPDRMHDSLGSRITPQPFTGTGSLTYSTDVLEWLALSPSQVQCLEDMIGANDFHPAACNTSWLNQRQFDIPTETTADESIGHFSPESTSCRARKDSASVSRHSSQSSARYWPCWEHGCNGRSFKSKRNYKRHLTEQRGLDSAVCSRCGIKFTRKGNCNKHEKTCSKDGAEMAGRSSGIGGDNSERR